MKIALTTVGTAGDVVPFVALAGALAAAGHGVTVHAPPFHRQRFIGLPSVRFEEAVGCGTEAELSAVIGRAVGAAPGSPVLDQRAQVELFLRHFYLRRGGDALRRAIEVFDGQDLVVANVIDHFGQAGAQVAGVPWACWTSRPPQVGRAQEVADRYYAAMDSELTIHLRQLVKDVGGSTLPAFRVFRSQSPLLTLVGAPAALVDRSLPLPPSCVVVGAWSPPGQDQPDLPEALEGFLASGPPPVFVTTGSSSNPRLLERLTAGVIKAGARVITQDAQGAAASCHDNERAVLPGLVSYPKLFQRVRAVVHHGGAGTTAAVCAAGKPSLVVPQMADQYLWARQVERVGVGPRSIPHWAATAEAVSQGVAELLTGGFAQRAEAIAALMAEEDGLALAVQRIEGLAVPV